MTVRAKKHLGQHFLKDEDTAKNIADSLTEVGYDNILEIGPGMGMLTKYLLDKKAKITVMEIDRDSVAFLKEEFRNEYINLDTSANNFEIIEGDFLKYDLASLVKEMVASDLEIFKKELLLKENGYTTSKESE